MATNTNLTGDIAVKLIRNEKTLCPKCRKSFLLSRYSNRSKNTIYKCPKCSEVYRPYKLI